MTRVFRHLAVLTVLIPLLIAGCGSDRPPNLVIVLVDTLRADHLAMHGYPRPVAPNVADLAARSTVFLRHYAHASRTGPSVASLLTGLHPPSHGVVNPLTHFDAKGRLEDEVTTLAEVLSKAGYDCHGIVANPNVGERFGFAQGYSSYVFHPFIRAKALSREALEVFDRATTPVFLYLHYMEPHAPYRAPDTYRDRWVDPGYDGPLDGSHELLDAVVAGDLLLTRAEVDRLKGYYDQEIAYFDDQLAVLLAGLAERGLADDTLVLFVSDHGEEFLDHGSALHGYTLYEEQLHVPCFLFDPMDPTGRRVDAITRHVDLLPTLLARLGVPAPDGVQGDDLAPHLRGEAEADDRPVYAQASVRAVRTVKAQSLQLGRWKYIRTTIPAPRMELYDLETDPGETRDLSEQDPERAAAMQRRLDDFVRDLPVMEAGTVTLTPDEIRHLRSLGYIK